jgi:hypothetical protein
MQFNTAIELNNLIMIMIIIITVIQKYKHLRLEIIFC